MNRFLTISLYHLRIHYIYTRNKIIKKYPKHYHYFFITY